MGYPVNTWTKERQSDLRSADEFADLTGCGCCHVLEHIFRQFLMTALRYHEKD